MYAHGHNAQRASAHATPAGPQTPAPARQSAEGEAARTTLSKRQSQALLRRFSFKAACTPHKADPQRGGYLQADVY